MNSRTAVICKIYGHAWNGDETETYMNMDGVLYPFNQTRRCNRCGKKEKNDPIKRSGKSYTVIRLSA